MPNYRRNRIPAGTYFFTVNLLERRGALLVAHIDALRVAVRMVRARRPFHIDAWVALSDHMHAVWTLPADDADYSGRRKAIKIAFATALPQSKRQSAVRAAKGERGIWQRRFVEHTIRDDRDYAARGLPPHQSRETRMGGPCAGLAVLLLSPLYGEGRLSRVRHSRADFGPFFGLNALRINRLRIAPGFGV